MIIKRLMAVFICLQIAIFPTYVFAISWSGIKGVATAAGGYFTGSATVGGAVKSAAATVPWSSLKNGLGKTLKIGGGVASIAIGLALDGADYVLDPANNTVKYKPVSDLECNSSNKCSSYSELYSIYFDSSTHVYFSPQIACQNWLASTKADQWGGSMPTIFASEGNCLLYGSAYNFQGNVGAGYGIVDNEYYDSTAVTDSEEQTKTISLSDLIQKLIDRMGNNDAAIKNVLDQLLSVAITEAQTNTKADEDIKALLNTIATALAKNAQYVESGTSTGTAAETKTENQTCTIKSTSSNCKTTGTSSTDLSLEFPAFCGWAAITCEAAQTVIDFPSTLTEYANTVSTAWADFWNEPDLQKKDDTVKVEEKQVDSPSKYDTDYVNFGGSCPTFPENTITVGSISIPLSFDLTPLCDWAKLVRPAVLGVAYLSALAIISTAIKDA